MLTPTHGLTLEEPLLYYARGRNNGSTVPTLPEHD